MTPLLLPAFSFVLSSFSFLTIPAHREYSPLFQETGGVFLLFVLFVLVFIAFARKKKLFWWKDYNFHSPFFASASSHPLHPKQKCLGNNCSYDYSSIIVTHFDRIRIARKKNRGGVKRTMKIGSHLTSSPPCRRWRTAEGHAWAWSAHARSYVSSTTCKCQ